MDPVVIIGAGPAGVAAAYELAKNGVPSVVVERADRVGGLSRTLPHNGALWDLGPHRFFTRNQEIRQLFTDILGPDAMVVDRLTRIFYEGKLFNYPISLLDTLQKVGPAQAMAFVGSYLGQRLINLVHRREPKSFEDWTVAQFGRSLFNAFFKTYTEKVWGIPCTQIGAEWASQRIKGLSLAQIIRNALFKPKDTAKSLVEQFQFPRLGAGMFYEQMAAQAVAGGAEILLNTRAVGFRHEARRVVALQVERDGHTEEIACTHLLTSNPITHVPSMADPQAPPEVLAAAKSLRYRCHMSVNLLVEGEIFPDNWIYVHSKEVVFGRIADYANFSPAMKDPQGRHPLTVEYFQFPDDELYCNPDDAAVVEFAKGELKKMGLVQPEQVVDGFVVRSRYAYPVLEIGYAPHMQTVRAYVDSFENLQAIGRGGMFKYNNQDHSIATGLLAARNILGAHHDVWAVNIDAEYHEDGKA